MRIEFVAIEYRTITKQSILSGKTTSRLIGADPAHWRAYAKGAKIQDAFPDLSPGDREFILSGATEAEWETLKPEDE